MKKVWALTSCTAIISATVFLFASSAEAQSLLSGDISGTVTDPSGAVISQASVELKGLDTGAGQSTKTDASGVYRFSLVKPGRYSVTVSEVNFQTATEPVTVAVGEVSIANAQLAVGQNSQTIEITDTDGVLSPLPGGATSFTPREVSLLPSPGGDITNIAFTAAGVAMSTAGGGSGGNFSMNGLPATSNLFTVNGENNMDPYLNINNSGATNMTLGQNEIQEATVLASPYGGQYGQLSGAQVIMVTKSGSNAFHGNAEYWWNGRDLNSNDWFNNYFGTPRPFSNDNQWAASLGGPIRKDKTFFFADYEGLRFVLPIADTLVIPTPAFSAAVLNNVTALQPREAADYKTMLNLFANAPGASTAHVLHNSDACNALSLPGFNRLTMACAAEFESNPSALASESFLAFRIDHKLSDRDNIFYRYRADRGTQPTVTDAVSPNFDALSKQPQWDNQLSETHVFSPTSTNQFIAAFSHYVAQFSQNAQAVASTFPYGVYTSGSVPFGGPLTAYGVNGFNAQGSLPSGRNITQYQIIDDYTKVKGRHTFKFGENYRRYDVSDHDLFHNNPTVYFGPSSSGLPDSGLQNFADGIAYRYRESKNVATEVPIAIWGLGAYAHDDWKIASNFTLTLGFRVEHNSNPVCQIDCFANFNTYFGSLPSAISSNPGSVPYSADISYGRHQAYQGVDALNVAPSFGFSWSPTKDEKTIVSGGFGVFYDNTSGNVLIYMLGNPPSSVGLSIIPAGGVLPFDPGPNGGAAIYQASANAFNIGETYSQISTALGKLGAVFTPPGIYSAAGTIHSPRVAQWNFQVQHELNSSTALILNYVGNHSGNIMYTDPFVNAYDAYGMYPGVKGIPATVPDANYGPVTQIQSGAVANYDGLQVTLRKQFSHNFSGHFNYTWSHALDDVSNGGITAFGGESLLGQLVPGSLAAANYGNADYDIRHMFTADFVYTPKPKTGSRFADRLVGGWQFGSKIIYHTGTPFSVTDTNAALGNYTGSLLAVPSGQPEVVAGGCGRDAATTPCLTQAGFIDGSVSGSYSEFSPQTRNQFRAPGYFNMDLNVVRNFPISDRVSFGLGVTAFNVLNHPNFGAPDSGYGDATYGTITSMVGSPTSPYGNGLGFDNSVRVVQLTGKVVF